MAGDLEKTLRIRAEMDAAQASEATAGLTAQVEGLAAAQSAVAPATEAAAAASQQEAAATTEAAVADARAAEAAAALAAAREQSAAAAAASRAVEEKYAAGAAQSAASTSTLLGAIGKFGIVASLAVAAIGILIDALQKVNQWTKEGADKLVSWAQGLKDSDIAVRKAGESLTDFAARANRARDAIAENERALYAQGQGAIAATSDLRLLGTEYQSLQAAIRGVIPTSEDFTKRIKELGITIPESFEHARAAVNTFTNLYQAAIQERGPAAAARFADQNRIFVEKSVQAFTDAGVAIPAELAKVIDALQTLGVGAEKAAKSIELQQKALREATAASDEHRAKLAGLASDLEKTTAAYEKSTKSIEDHRKAEIDDANAAEKEVVESVNAQIAALNRQYEAFAIAGDAYREKFAALQLELVDARRAREVEEDKINADAVAKQAEAAKAFSEASLTVSAAMAREGATAREAGEAKAALGRINEGLVEGLNAAASAESATAASMATTTAAIRDQADAAAVLSRYLQEIADRNIPSVISQLGEFASAMQSAEGKTRVLEQAAMSLFGDVGESGGGAGGGF